MMNQSKSPGYELLDRFFKYKIIINRYSNFLITWKALSSHWIYTLLYNY